MKVFIVTTESFPNGMAATQRIRCYAQAITKGSELDCEVIIVNGLDDNNKKLGNTYLSGRINGYTFRFIGRERLANNNAKRALDIIRFLKYLVFTLKRGDAVIFYAYNLYLLKAVKRVCKYKGARLYLELCEHPSIQFEQFLSEGVDDTLKELSPILKGVSGVFVISHELETLVKSVETNTKTLLIPILYENSKGLPLKKNKPDYKYIFHSGSLTQKKDGVISLLEAFAKALPELPNDVRYLFTGDLSKSPDNARIQSCITTHNLNDRVMFLGYLNEEDLCWYQENAYMAIIYKDDNLQNKYCFATKIGEYLRAGTLLVLSKIGEPTYYLRNDETCVFHDNDVDDLTHVISELFNNTPKRDIIAAQGKSFSNRVFFCENYAEGIISFLFPTIKR